MSKQIRPRLETDIGQEFADYCRDNGLLLGVAATNAIALWLKQQKVRSTEEEAIAS